MPNLKVKNGAGVCSHFSVKGSELEKLQES